MNSSSEDSEPEELVKVLSELHHPSKEYTNPLALRAVTHFTFQIPKENNKNSESESLVELDEDGDLVIRRPSKSKKTELTEDATFANYEIAITHALETKVDDVGLQVSRYI
jgi:hypothetical protein